MKPCPFCDPASVEILDETATCFAFLDRFPVTPLHALIVARRHVVSYRELDAEEWSDVMVLARRVSRALQERDPAVAGFNLGINDGRPAGQTVAHAHIHLIPRRAGDVPNARGGVRWIFPDRADYTGDVRSGR